MKTYANFKIVSCLNCGAEVKKTNAELSRYPNSFCSSNCSATYNNNKRIAGGYTTKGSVKKSICFDCGIEIEVSIHTSYHKLLCEKCQSKDGVLVIGGVSSKPNSDANIHTLYCKECGDKFKARSKTRQYCSPACSTLGNIEKQSKTMTAKVLNGKVKPIYSIRCTYEFGSNKINCDSLLEYACLNYFVNSFSIQSIARCDFSIQYTFNGKQHNYIPDFIIETPDVKYIVECKSVVGKALSKKWRDYKEKAIIKKQTLSLFAKENNMVDIWFSTEISEYKKEYEKLTNARRAGTWG